MSIRAAELFITVNADTRDAEQGLRSVNDKMNSAARGLTMTGAALTAGVTLPLLAIGKAALDSAMDFEQNMNILQQVSGATAGTMQALQDEALRLGAVTSFSAGEAAEGMLELAKAGMSTEEVLASIGGVMDLAAAGGIGLAQAAGITAAALNAFHLEASESGRVADLLAAAANASAADIGDLAAGMQQAGFAFSATGQEIDDLAASLAILTNVGLTGSDAGTALKNAMTRLMAPTGEAVDMMRSLGLYSGLTEKEFSKLEVEMGRTQSELAGLDPAAKNYQRRVEELNAKLLEQRTELVAGGNAFFDVSGNMLPLARIIGVLNEATAGLTMEQRNSALATIFLSDGMKAMIPLLEVGEDGFLAMKDAVNEEGAAGDVANARMKGLAGGIEYLKGSVDSFLITTALPFLDTLGSLARGAGDLLTQFGELPEPIRNATLIFLGFAAALGPLLMVMGAVVGALASPLLPIALLIVGVAALSAAWIANVGGIQEITAAALAPVQEWFASTLAGATDLATGIGTAFSNTKFPSLESLWNDFQAGDFETMAEKMKITAYQLMVNLDTELNITAQAQGLKAQLDQRAADIDAFGLNMVSGLTDQINAADWSTMSLDTANMVSSWADNISSMDWSEAGVNAGKSLRDTISEAMKGFAARDNTIANEFDQSFRDAIADIEWGGIWASTAELETSVRQAMSDLMTGLFAGLGAEGSKIEFEMPGWVTNLMNWRPDVPGWVASLLSLFGVGDGSQTSEPTKGPSPILSQQRQLDLTSQATPLAWSDFVPSIVWSEWIPDFGFGAGLTGWGSFVPDLEWPTIPAFNWGDFVESINPFAGSNFSEPTEPQGQVSAAGGTRFAGAGRGSGITIKIENVTLANDMDIEAFALRVATKIKQKMR